MNRRLLAFLALVVLGTGAWWMTRRQASGPIANAPPRPGPIIAFGDSLTQGMGTSAGGSYPDQLSRLLGRPVLNRGVGGETASQALRRLESDVLAHEPGVVLVCLGGNDLLQSKAIEETFAVLDTIVGRLTEAGAMVVLIGIEGVPVLTPDYGERFETLAERHACLYVPDFLDGIFGRDGLMADPIHPNTDGYAIIAGRIAKALGPYL